MRTRRLLSSSDPMPLNEGHRSVLLHESLEQLELKPTDVVVDATLGGAGHSREIAKRLSPEGTLIGIDADHAAILRAREILEGSAPTVLLEEGNFRYLSSLLERLGIPSIDKALFDLGWSSFQLAAGRGFSFLKDEPLLMTYAENPEGLTARIVVNDWAEESLADIIFGWGGETYSRRIARGIVEARAKKPIETSRELGEIIRSSVPHAYRVGRLHPATKTFQALRIAVNDEMGALKKGLIGAWESLRVGGRIAVITFHSVEDREVKRLFLEWAGKDEAFRVTKSPIKPSREELIANPRARSAKLRVIEKI
jgi:16S rRNA (cytosine1402-N4)-methyltransferase